MYVLVNSLTHSLTSPTNRISEGKDVDHDDDIKVGATMSKVFIEKTNRGEIVEKTFRGKVVSCGDLDESTQKVLYHIRYEDGDEEVHDAYYLKARTHHKLKYSRTHIHTGSIFGRITSTLGQQNSPRPDGCGTNVYGETRSGNKLIQTLSSA